MSDWLIRVRDLADRPVPGARITVTQTDGHSRTDRSDGNGTKHFDVRHEATVEVTHAGKRPWRRRAIAHTGDRVVTVGLTGVSSPSPGPSLPPLTVAGRLFGEGGAPFDYREVTSFTVFGDLHRGDDDRVRAWMAWAKSHGFTTLRPLGNYGGEWWEPKGYRFHHADPGYTQALEAGAELAQRVGLYLRVAIFGHYRNRQASSPQDPFVTDPIGYTRLVIRTLRPFPNVIFEVANEPRQLRIPDRLLQQCMTAASREVGDRLLAYGPVEGNESHDATWFRSPADYGSFHAERRLQHDGWEWLKRMTDWPNMRVPGLPALSGEPVNAGDGGANPTDRVSNPAVWFAYGAASRLFEDRFIPTLHCHPGIFCALRGDGTMDPSVQRCVEAFHRGCDAVPLDVGGTWCNGHQSCSPFRGFSQTDPPRDDRPYRIAGRVAGGRYIGVGLRVPRGYQPDTTRALTVVDQEHPAGERFGAVVWTT